MAFNPAINGGLSGMMGMAEYGAMVPGKLANDASSNYTVSRRYPATAEQVNAIIEASQTYADGGYGYYARNCTTFVRDMAKVANLPVSDDLFELEDVAFSDLANFARVGAGIPGKNNLADMESKFVSISQDEDQSYANYGNKRVTEADFERYSQSIEGRSGSSKRTYIPGTVGEKLRRETTGEIGSQSYRGKVKKDDDVKKIRTEINRHGNELNELLMRELLAEAGRSNNDEIPQELIDMVRPLPRSGEVLLPIEAAHDRGETVPIDQIRSARQQLSADIKKLNTIFFQYFKGDKRLSKPVMNLISLMNVGINILDKDYEAALQTQDFDNDLGNLSGKISEEKEVSVGDKGVEITPSYYEAYLQIYKTPKEAVNAYYRFVELANMNDEGYKWSLHPLDAKEFKKRRLIHTLAEQFVASHRYMLEKESYDQKDVDYALMQYNREKSDHASGEMLKKENVTTGNAYISLILEKVFKGMRQRYKTFISQNEENKQAEKLRDWMDNDLSDSLLKNKDQMLTFLRGLKKTMTNQNRQEVDPKVIYTKLKLMIYDFWINRLFSSERTDMDQDIQMQMPNIFDSIMSQTSDKKKFQNLVITLIKQVVMEDKAAEDDLVKLWRSGKNGKEIS